MADLAESQHNMLFFKIMLVGKGGAGKTSIVSRYIYNKFSHKIQLTTGIDFALKTIKYKGKTIKLEIWDTAGQQTFRSMCYTRFKRANAVIGVYDIGDKQNQSFNELKNYWMSKAKDQCPQNCVFAVFGNKSDQISDPASLNALRDKMVQQLKELSEKLKIDIFGFIGNCFEEGHPAIGEMIMQIVQKLHDQSEEQIKKRLEESHLNQIRAEIKKPSSSERQSFHLDNKKKVQQQKKSSFCPFF